MLVCHHIASGSWSMQVLMADLAAAYEARLGGREPGWDPLPVQYADYALWQQELLGDGGVLAGQVGYWREALAGLPEELALPYDRPRPAVPSQRVTRSGGSWQARELHGALARLARDHQVSIFMVLHAGLAGLLSRMGAGPDIPLGAPAAGRTDEAVHALVGVLREHAGAACRRVGRPRRSGMLVGRVREAVLARAGPPGRAVRAAGGGAEPVPVGGPAPAVPGDDRRPGRRRRPLGAARPGRPARAGPRPGRQVRPDPGIPAGPRSRRRARRDYRGAGVRRGPVRRAARCGRWRGG